MNYPTQQHEVFAASRPTRRRKSKLFVVNGAKLAMLIVPTVLLTIVLTLVFHSNVTGETPRLDTVQAWGNNTLSLEGKVDRVMPSVRSLPCVPETSEQTEAEEPASLYTDREIELIAKTVYGEALVTNSDMEMAAVVWCILNRVDSPYYPDTIEGVVTQRRQFHGYNESHPVTARIERLARDVLDRWFAEKNGDTDCGRVLPKDYIYFEGDGKHNHYSTEWLSDEFYDWSLPNPYEN